MNARTIGVWLLPLVLSVMSGLALGLAFPPWNQEYLVWAGFIPVLAALLLFRSNWLKSLFCGALFGLCLGTILFFWLLDIQAVQDWMIAVGGLGLIGAIWGALLGLLVRLPTVAVQKRVAPILPGPDFQAGAWTASIGHLQVALFAASLWAVLDWARGIVLPGWNPVGAVLQSNLPLFQTVSVTGVAGLSFLVVFTNVILFTTVRRIIRSPGRMTWASRFDVTVTLGVLFISALLGFMSLQRRSAFDHREIGLITNRSQDVSQLIEQSQPAIAQNADLLVWHAAAVQSGDYPRFANAGIGAKIGLVTGLASAGKLNGALVVLPGMVKSLYVVNKPGNIFQSGAAAQNLGPFSFKDVTWLPVLNWEAGNQHLLRGSAQQGIQVLIALVGPIPYSHAGIEQLLLNLRTSVTEFGRPLIFSGNDLGVVLNANGKLLLDSRRNSDAGLMLTQIEVPTTFDSTLYSRYGDWFAISCGAVALAMAISQRLRQRNEKIRGVSP